MKIRSKEIADAAKTNTEEKQSNKIAHRVLFLQGNTRNTPDHTECVAKQTMFEERYSSFRIISISLSIVLFI